jgi:hypothetical protein
MAVALTDRQRFFANQYGVDRELFQRCRGLHLQIGTTNWLEQPTGGPMHFHCVLHQRSASSRCLALYETDRGALGEGD